MSEYLEESTVEKKDINMLEKHQVIRFWPSKHFFKRMNDKKDIRKVSTWLVDKEEPFLCGKEVLEELNSIIDTRKCIL